MTGRLTQLLPAREGELTDAEILAAYAAPSGPWLRVNFVSSIDGASTRDAQSGGLGDAADRRVFGLLRRLADTVLVGAGTIRAEGYAGPLLSSEGRRWRAEHSMTEHPTLAIVSASLDLDPRAEVFSAAPVRPLILTVESASAERRARLEVVADVVDVGQSTLDARALRNTLIARGLPRIHCEGGPSLFGTLLEADLVDEVCLTIAPTLEAGDAARIAHSKLNAQIPMRLAALLRAENELFLRYVR